MYHEFTIQIADPWKDALMRRLSDKTCLGVIDEDARIIAYYLEEVDPALVLRSIELFRTVSELAGDAVELSVRHQLIPHQDWNESWKKGFIPLPVGDHFVIRPPWEQDDPNRTNLIIDPAMAFGTGHHETTRSCLVLLERAARGARKQRFLDLGSGTGILAIAAAKIGFAHVLAVDTDPLAVDATRTNAALNGVALDVREGSADGIDGVFDLITANIISGVLIELAPAIAGLLDPNGVAILSGMLADQGDEVSAAMKQSGLTTRERYPDGKWVSLVVRHTQGGASS